ncbi:zinc finger HIT domain-containing protein 2 [Episyrphus balteatus]|uniref:zinc finger HIT domain-containing protein 2 n=1 Tax=Episyrphus balteatus TaxID=286459 RepID=UPI0024869471|nr:zinc finger HIT domain-containing protein 2 [Episyrphus balteatus]
MSSSLCKICNKNDFKYSCPKCNILYCSLTCYKSPEHLKCSEEFYKKCVEDEISATSNPTDDVKKMYDILNRLNHQFEEDEFDLDAPQELDSDDDNDNEDENDIANRLEGIDINDSEEIWKRLTDVEKKDFQLQIENGEIAKLLPKYSPWWSIYSNKLVVPISNNSTPAICENIPLFSTIYSKEPPACIHNNLWNILAAYACTVKFFNGEHQTNSWEATKYLVGLSANLKTNVNFDDAEQAVVAIEMQALEDNIPLPCEQFAEIEKDTRQIIAGGLDFKLAALSDTLNLFKIAKDQQFGKKSKQTQSEFNKSFDGHFEIDLSKSNLNLIIKKIEFFLSFVARDSHRNTVL